MSDTSYKIGGVFHCEHIRDGKVIDSWDSSNIVVDEGLNYILNGSLRNATIIPSWYIGVFKNNYTPVATDVISVFPGAGAALEATTDYSETSRPIWSPAISTAKQLSNSAAPGTFTFTAAATVYGAFLTSSSVKGATSGVLIAASKFSASKAMLSTDQLNISYIISASSV